ERHVGVRDDVSDQLLATPPWSTAKSIPSGALNRRQHRLKHFGHIPRIVEIANSGRRCDHTDGLSIKLRPPQSWAVVYKTQPPRGLRKANTRIRQSGSG